MRIAVTGSIATDHLMTFPGRFTDQLLPDQLTHISLSFLVDDLEVRHGGVAANICYGLGSLGQQPLLVGAVGLDFADRESRLKERGVNTHAVRVSADRQTARFMCITDQDANQIASFYTGAMAEAAEIDLAPIAASPGGLDLVLVTPNDPAAMLRHTHQAREFGIPFAADPSQQLARLGQEEAIDLVDGATWLFTNKYEAALLLERTGLPRDALLERIGTWVTTLGENGVRIERAGRPTIAVPAVPDAEVVEPTGAGDAFRAGFLTGLAHGVSLEAAARLGCVLAATVLAEVGSQSYDVTPPKLSAQIESAYGTAAAAELADALDGAS
ncbi:carbohydrate kinase family protein [Streptomyces longisporoflavus]|uniref:Carbohydrate kinase family protein n=1 Tax=Streptomyces longisporoflavus TaxID=28044 RepID=A0ABW7R3T7_9ACTN